MSLTDCFPDFQTLHVVSDWAAADLGVTLAVYDYGTDIFVSNLKRSETAAKGSGVTAVTGLSRYADKIGKPLTLVVISGEPRLIAYYGRLDFKPDGPVTRRGENVRMRRNPR